MAYRKLTKRQWKDREKILAWLNGEEFRENSRAKPAVPELSVGEVLEFYVPPDVTGAGQYFTPAEMSQALVGYMDPAIWNSGVRVLDPCAGIGHLLWPLVDVCDHWADEVEGLVAYEIEQECVKIGQRLFPKIEWNWEIPFDRLDRIEGQFDFVVMNPPFNVTRGMASGWEMSQGRCTKSEHVFLELAVRVCKPGGQIGVIAPYNFWDKLPNALRLWLEDKAALDCKLGQLPGEFAMSGVRVHGYVITRLVDIYERTAERQKGIMTEVRQRWEELNPPVAEQLSLL